MQQRQHGAPGLKPNSFGPGGHWVPLSAFLMVALQTSHFSLLFFASLWLVDANALPLTFLLPASCCPSLAGSFGFEFFLRFPPLCAMTWSPSSRLSSRMAPLLVVLAGLGMHVTFP